MNEKRGIEIASPLFICFFFLFFFYPFDRSFSQYSNVFSLCRFISRKIRFKHWKSVKLFGHWKNKKPHYCIWTISHVISPYHEIEHWEKIKKSKTHYCIDRVKEMKRGRENRLTKATGYFFFLPIRKFEIALPFFGCFFFFSSSFIHLIVRLICNLFMYSFFFFLSLIDGNSYIYIRVFLRSTDSYLKNMILSPSFTCLVLTPETWKFLVLSLAANSFEPLSYVDLSKDDSLSIFFLTISRFGSTLSIFSFGLHECFFSWRLSCQLLSSYNYMFYTGIQSSFYYVFLYDAFAAI